MFGRSNKLPPELRPQLERDERVLAWARAGDAAAVATNRGLWLPGAAARLGWHEIHKATWSDEVLTVVPATLATDAGGFSIVSDAPAISIRLSEPGALPRRVRERVTASVAVSSLHKLPGGGGARVVARRVSGVDGLSWSVRLEGGASDEDPAVLAVAADLVAAERAAIAPPD